MNKYDNYVHKVSINFFNILILRNKWHSKANASSYKQIKASFYEKHVGIHYDY